MKNDLPINETDYRREEDSDEKEAKAKKKTGIL